MLARPTPRLVFWDIDKTLVDIGDVSREIYAAAFMTVTGLELERMPNMAGKTDRDLIVASLRLHDIPEPESHLADFYHTLATAADARKPKSSDTDAACQAHVRLLNTSPQYPVLRSQS